MGPGLFLFGADLWIAEGPVVSFFGFAYPTRMAVIRLSNGDLFVWSPIALSEALKREVDALGPVRYLISPNKLHHLFMPEWKKAYPGARLYASPGLAKKRRDISFDAELGDAPAPEWAADIDQVMLKGSFALTDMVFFHRKSRTAIFNDIIQNFRPGWFKGWRGWLARIDGITAPHPGAPREWRATFNRRKAHDSLARILAWPIEHVVIAHGELPKSDAANFVKTSLAWLRD